METKASVKGYEFRVVFDYNPYEPSTRHYPGCSESVEINEIFDYDGEEVKDYAFDILESLVEEQCLESVHDEQDRVTDAQMEYADGLHEDSRLDAMDGLITQINKSTRKINEIRAKIPGKTVDELIKEFSNEPTL